jgi:membrane protease subunit (stomatin/prohibitin family)
MREAGESSMPNITQIIKYEGDNDTFIWKHPNEDFNTMTQLIVHESQEAVLFLNGQALDLFGPGRHTLEAQNIPLIRRVLQQPTAERSPFHCEIYFINKTEHFALKWGTDSKVQYMEPTYNFPLQIGASGEMSLRADDSRKLLIKVVGTAKSFCHTELSHTFRAFLQGRIKPYLAQTMREGKISIFETDEHMAELSDSLHAQLVPDFAEYGLALEHFFVTVIVKPDGDRAYEKFKEIHIRQYSDVAEAQIRQRIGIIDQETEARRMVIESDALAEKRRREGYTYQQERGFDVAEKVAQNEGVGNYSQMGIGFGLIGGVAGGIGASVANITGDAVKMAAQEKTQEPVDETASFMHKIKKLKMLQENGLLSEEELESEKRKLLDAL